MKKAVKILLWLFVAVVIITAVSMTYKDITKNLPQKPKETFSDDGPKLSISLFYAVWCGHCEKYLDSKVFMTTYDDLKKSGKYDNVVFVQYDYDKNKEMAKKYNVGGFPTIIAISSDGKLVDEFNGDRYDPNALQQFVDSSLAKLR